jgi:hypothetical protein
VANIPSIAMESKNRDRPSLSFVGRAKEESTQSFAIGCWNGELLMVFDTVLRGTRDICASSWWDVAWINDFARTAFSKDFFDLLW